MFNNYARLSSTRFTFLNNVNAHEFAIVELMIEQQFATSFDDIYTMHIYRDNAHNYKYVVDVAFELHTNTFYVDEYDNATYENIHSYDMRVNVDVSSNEIDYDEICNTIEHVKFDVVHCNAYTSINYVHSWIDQLHVVYDAYTTCCLSIDKHNNEWNDVITMTSSKSNNAQTIVETTNETRIARTNFSHANCEHTLRASSMTKNERKRARANCRATNETFKTHRAIDNARIESIKNANA